MRKRGKDSVWIACCLLAAALPTVTAGEGKPVRFEARDGFELAATHFDPGKPGPGVLLLHQCNADRTMWAAIGLRLAEAGIHVLAMDYRGYGDSTKGGGVTIETSNSLLKQRLHDLADADILAGYRKLVSLPGVDSTRIATGGASCGGPRSIRLARAVDGLRTMVFLSTYVDDELIDAEGPAGKLPILAITAENDGRTTSSLRRLFETSTNPDSRLVLYKGDEHGHPLFGRDHRLASTIVDWYRDHLP